MKRLLLLLPLLFVLLPATASGSAKYVLQVDLYGAYVAPPVETSAWGFVRFFFNEERTEAEYGLDVKGISNTGVTGVTIREGAPGENGPVVFTLSEGDFIVSGGVLALTPEELETFVSGAWYLLLTTVAHPEGELRGQIVVPADFFSPTADGAAYPPPSQPPSSPPVGPETPPVRPTEGDGESAPEGPVVIQPPNTGSGGLK